MADRISIDDSQFISAIRITMIIGLVVHHLFAIPNSGYYPRFHLSAEFFNVANLSNALVHWTTMAAVPLLSIISGYLYFARPQVNHRTLLKKRMRTVVLPSLCWTTFWFISGLALAYLGRPYGILQWMAYNDGQVSVLMVLNGIIGITAEPMAMQFWFIHDLALTLALVPLLSWLLRRFGLAFLAVLTLFWFIWTHPSPFFYGNVIYFFCVGSLLAMRSISLTHAALVLRRWWPAVIVGFLFLLFTRVFSGLHPLFASDFWLALLRIGGVLIVALLLAARLQQPQSKLHWLRRFSPYAFFIFAFHYPLIDIIKIICERIPLQQTVAGQLLTLALAPAVTVVLCIYLAKLTERLLPRLFVFINGGRELEPKQAAAAKLDLAAIKPRTSGDNSGIK